MLITFKLTGRYRVELNVLVPYLAQCKGIQIPQSGKFWLVESGILGFEIRNTAQGVKNPSSTDKYRDPESQPVLDSHSWGDISMVLTN